jgi:hypothetical protein
VASLSFPHLSHRIHIYPHKRRAPRLRPPITSLSLTGCWRPKAKETEPDGRSQITGIKMACFLHTPASVCTGPGQREGYTLTAESTPRDESNLQRSSWETGPCALTNRPADGVARGNRLSPPPNASLVRRRPSPALVDLLTFTLCLALLLGVAWLYARKAGCAAVFGKVVPWWGEGLSGQDPACNPSWSQGTCILGDGEQGVLCSAARPSMWLQKSNNIALRETWFRGQDVLNRFPTRMALEIISAGNRILIVRE